MLYARSDTAATDGCDGAGNRMSTETGVLGRRDPGNENESTATDTSVGGI